MSNKKLFWVAFFILSFCEFAQVAYSKTVAPSPQVAKSGVIKPHFTQQIASNSNLSSTVVFQVKPDSYSLPR